MLRKTISLILIAATTFVAAACREETNIAEDAAKSVALEEEMKSLSDFYSNVLGLEFPTYVAATYGKADEKTHEYIIKPGYELIELEAIQENNIGSNIYTGKRYHAAGFFGEGMSTLETLENGQTIDTIEFRIFDVGFTDVYIDITLVGVGLLDLLYDSFARDGVYYSDHFTYVRVYFEYIGYFDDLTGWGRGRSAYVKLESFEILP
ncbi:MAG: hypothetical protein FWH17_04625 [Oscillospiraceae bacterium]|nr:hypothetical protein [Oscillospiraceae bacterium]